MGLSISAFYTLNTPCPLSGYVLQISLLSRRSWRFREVNNLQSDRAALKWHLLYQPRSRAPKHRVHQQCERGMPKVWVPEPPHCVSDCCSFCPEGRYPFVTSLPYGSHTLLPRVTGPCGFEHKVVLPRVYQDSFCLASLPMCDYTFPATLF